ncbi:MAG: phosphatase PAP2 family protein [Tannerellaceae bacterium]|jgi:membrane-associated phospholipid phosphatase|nr:phosphatase PAP2 family protein [Tannerellaceae bacterium]
MNHILLYCLLSFAIPANTLFAQSDTIPFRSEIELRVSPSYTKLILPAALISYGVMSHVSPTLKKLDHHITNAVANPGTKVDDYLQYVPVVSLYALDLAGVKAKNNLRDRVFLTLSSYIFMGASVNAIKYTAKVMRPDNSTANSFPSGHTAMAFAGAHLLFREYGETSPWIGVAAYTTATATGLMRMVNNRHWMSDVIAGAGIAILSVEAGYMLLPVFRRIMGDGGAAIAISPVAGSGMYGLGFACRF